MKAFDIEAFVVYGNGELQGVHTSKREAEDIAQSLLLEDDTEPASVIVEKVKALIVVPLNEAIVQDT